MSKSETEIREDAAKEREICQFLEDMEWFLTAKTHMKAESRNRLLSLARRASKAERLVEALRPFAECVHENSEGVEVDRLGASRLDFLSARAALTEWETDNADA